MVALPLLVQLSCHCCCYPRHRIAIDVAIASTLLLVPLLPLAATSLQVLQSLLPSYHRWCPCRCRRHIAGGAGITVASLLMLLSQLHCTWCCHHGHDCVAALTIAWPPPPASPSHHRCWCCCHHHVAAAGAAIVSLLLLPSLSRGCQGHCRPH
ncbi:hypothetical protein BC827DRAFT_1213834 [Russula dissimulans]|nr:hypothetical protein BC827DRAFT_1213834 [Russula dissimulans]